MEPRISRNDADQTEEKILNTEEAEVAEHIRAHCRSRREYDGKDMTARERFHLTMSFGRPDRVPWLEEGLRDDVLRRWESEGLAPGADLGSIFHYDRRERIELDLTPRPAIALPEDWAQRVQRWRDRDHILELFVHRGLFLTMGVEAWASLDSVLYQIADHPDQVRRVLDEQAQYTVRLIDRVLADVEVDCASFSEPIGDTHGPMISPAMYRRVVLASYGPIIEALRRHGVRTIVWMTYANARVLLRDVLEAGFDCLWAMEAESTDMDYRALRHEFGKSLRLIGGIDLDVLLRDEEAIRREIQEKVPPLLAEGGFIPLADGRVRASIPLHNYLAYRRALERITT